ncbi:MAG: hypothetical protein KBG28_23985 [Kofleriaceae bacterium]|jgi:hypothetical protein|nr:hypothetical protein [Kofleriaceae bacterium]MBP9207051.1 hypothetical protein [Kofleriaceae bacterium]
MLVAALRLTGFAVAVALLTSRLGLLVHEVVGHGGVAWLGGARVDELALFWFAGGYIHYQVGQDDVALALAIQLAGIGVEAVVAGLVVASVRGRVGALATAARVAGWACLVHASFYLAAGTWHGFGDGVGLFRQLGRGRVLVVAPAALLMLGAVAAGVRALAPLADVVPGPRPARRWLVLAAALLVAGATHGALTAGELTVRADRRYAEVMRREPARIVDRELAAWLAAERARGAVDAAAVARRRHELARQQAVFPLAPVLVVLAALVALGTAWSSSRRANAGAAPTLGRRELAWLALAATGAVAAVVVVAQLA